MTTSDLSVPVLVSPADLRSDPGLTAQIIDLINDAFKRSQQPDPERWDFEVPRFSTLEAYYDMLVENTVIALVFDRSAQYSNNSGLPMDDSQQSVIEGQSDTSGTVVACASAVPWRGGWRREGADKEEGWEIKAVAVSGDLKYSHKGLAVQMMASLEGYLIKLSKLPPQVSPSKELTHGKNLTLWLLVAECINGVYWRKRGYSEIRRSREGLGTWGCKTSFDLVVYRRVVEVNVAD
jgi:hypothetical protein